MTSCSATGSRERENAQGELVGCTYSTVYFSEFHQFLAEGIAAPGELREGEINSEGSRSCPVG